MMPLRRVGRALGGIALLLEGAAAVPVTVVVRLAALALLAAGAWLVFGPAVLAARVEEVQSRAEEAAAREEATYEREVAALKRKWRADDEQKRARERQLEELRRNEPQVDTHPDGSRTETYHNPSIVEPHPQRTRQMLTKLAVVAETGAARADTGGDRWYSASELAGLIGRFLEVGPRKRRSSIYCVQLVGDRYGYRPGVPRQGPGAPRHTAAFEVYPSGGAATSLKVEGQAVYHDGSAGMIGVVTVVRTGPDRYVANWQLDTTSSPRSLEEGLRFWGV